MFRWRHKARQTCYDELGRGQLQARIPVKEGDTLVAYKGDDGQIWFRPQEEFDDGRYEKVPDTLANKAERLVEELALKLCEAYKTTKSEDNLRIHRESAKYILFGSKEGAKK